MRYTLLTCFLISGFSLICTGIQSIPKQENRSKLPLEIKLKERVSVNNAQVCLSNIIEFDSISTNAIKKKLVGKCLEKTPLKPKIYSKERIKQFLFEAEIYPQKITGKKVTVFPVLKRIPYSVILDFLNRNTTKKKGTWSFSNEKRVQKGILVPEKANIFFELDTMNKKIFVKAKKSDKKEDPSLSDQFENVKWIQFADISLIETKYDPKVENEFDHDQKDIRKEYDIERGQDISIILEENFIRIKLTGKTLQPGKIGNKIRVWSNKLKRNFNAILVRPNEAEIINNDL